ncbi:MAG: GT4 family glycosyltransferase PelF [Bulleidia sp.]|nr:GT4 family glycosyltransferase PelF [Bulleidia sp.]
MKICMIAEGCYPFITGGVSSWIQSMIKSFPEHEYIILAIAADRSYRGKYAYELPENVSAVYEVYLNDKDWSRKRRKIRLNKQEYTALRSIVLNTQTDWDTVYRMFQKDFSIDDLLMGKDFLDIATELYDKQYPEITFSDFLWTLRSIYLPLFIVLKTKLPKADVYHCVATGYSGILGCMGKSLYGGKLLVSEHGIYGKSVKST